MIYLYCNILCYYVLFSPCCVEAKAAAAIQMKSDEGIVSRKSRNKHEDSTIGISVGIYIYIYIYTCITSMYMYVIMYIYIYIHMYLSL